MNESIVVEISDYGPFSRISLTRPDRRFPRPPQLSVYLVGDTLIDTGGSLTAAALVDTLRAQPPHRVLCTHQHEDHVGGVAALRAAFGHIPVYIPAPHAPLLPDFDRVPSYRALFWGNPTPIVDAVPYHAGDVFEVGALRLDTIETPGHTPGHISFVTRAGAQAFVLSGDLYTTSPLVAWYESSAPCLLRSSREVASLALQVTMLPTHGRVRADGREAFESLVEQVEPVCERVERAAETLGVGHGPGASDAQYWALAEHLFGPDDGFARVSEGEWSHACFVRSVLDPVRHLPAAPLPPLSPAGLSRA